MRMKKLLFLLATMLATSFGLLAQGTSWQTATLITSGSTKTGTLDNNTTEAWYKINVTQEGHVDFDVTATGTLTFGSCNLNGYWNDALRYYAGFDGYGSNHETCNIVNAGRGTYYIRIVRYGGSGTFKLKYTFTACSLSNDPEPNEDYQQTSLLQSGRTVQGRLGYRNSENETDNVDWYRIEVPQEGHVDITVTGTETLTFASCNLNGYWDDALRYYGGFAGYGNDTATYNAIDVGRGTYYIKIERYNGSGGYKLNYKFTPCSLSNDPEPNGEYQQNSLLQSGKTAQGRLGYRNSENVTDGVDWYRIEVPEEGHVDIVATGTETLTFGSCNVFGYWNDAIREYGGFSGYNNDTTIYSSISVGPGTYYIRIARYNGSGGYKLNYTFTPCPLANDAEPNQDYQSAAWLPSGITMQGRLGYCNSENVTDNEDWYRFTVNKAGDVEFTATGTETLKFGSCTVYGVRDDGSLYSKGNFSGYNNSTATFSGTNYDVGTYYVRITRYGGSGGYRLTYNGPTMTGDVDGDNTVIINDVTALIDYLLGSTSAVEIADSDVDGDGVVSISDVTKLIDALLKGN
jgi:hypothetical protein